MGIFRKIKASLLDDWCGTCQVPMDVTLRRLYTLPMTVGHYIPHKDAEYYRRNLSRAACRADIPAGVYACEAIAYRCPGCGRRIVMLSIFLPVRDLDKWQDSYLFSRGELDDFLGLP